MADLRAWREKAPPKPPQERRALRLLRQEAKARGTTLASNGEGGLPSSLVLHVFRRDKYRCVRCGTRDDISLHHLTHVGVPRSQWMLDNPKADRDPKNLITICESCHNDEHKEDEELNEAANKAGAHTPAAKLAFAERKGEAV